MYVAIATIRLAEQPGTSISRANIDTHFQTSILERPIELAKPTISLALLSLLTILRARHILS
jgi:hypothetical protein